MLSVECKKGLPLEHELFLKEKYSSFISTCRYVEVYYPTHELYHLLVYKNGELIDLLLLGKIKNSVFIFNALVSFEQQIMELCIDKIFELFPKISNVKIDASYTEYELKKSLLFYKSDDYILNLPSNIDEYTTKLGSKTRKHLKARRAKLDTDFKSVDFVIKYGEEIGEDLVDKIIQLNFDRMQQKGKVHGIDTNYKKNIYKYSRYYGFILYLELDGKLVAGCIASIINRDVFLHVIAHDNEFSKYNVGEVCVFSLIQTSIDKKLQKLHFLWGFSELKRRLLAEPQLLYSYSVFRSRSPSFFLAQMKLGFSEVLISFKQLKLADYIRTAVYNFRKKKFSKK